MKNSAYCIVFALAISAASARAQFFWHVIHADQDDQTRYAFNSISCSGNNCTAGLTMIDLSTWAWTFRFYQTSDGGISWYTQDPKVDYPVTFPNNGVTKIQRIDSLNIVAIGRDSGFIIRSFDGGETWQRQYPPTQQILKDIHFSDSLTGILVAADDSNNVFLTSDGGRHWNISPFTGPFLWQCHSYGGGKFRLMKYGSGKIYKTSDSFNTVDETKPVFDSTIDPHWFDKVLAFCTFSSKDTILAYGTSARPGIKVDTLPGFDLIIRSVDGGITWEKPFIFSSGVYGSIRYTTQLDRDTVIATAESANKIFHSYDRGKTWQIDSLIMDTNYAYSIYTNGISMTKNGNPIAIFSLVPVSGSQAILIRGKLSDHSDVAERIINQTCIYPNPTTGFVNIESVDKHGSILVIDIFGRRVLSGILPDVGKLTLDFSSLSSGIYSILMDYGGRRQFLGKVALVEK